MKNTLDRSVEGLLVKGTTSSPMENSTQVPEELG